MMHHKGKFVFTGLMVALLTWIFISPPCYADSENTSIPFNLADFVIILDVKINDNPKTYKFVFDTGGRNTINPKLFKELKIFPPDSVDWRGDAGMIGYHYMVDSLQIGPVEKDSVWMWSFISEKKDLFAGFDGFLAADIFGDQILTIDYKNRILSLTSDSLPMKPDSDAILLNYVIESHTANMGVTLAFNDSMKIEAIFDTGFPAALALPTAYLDSLKDELGSSLIKSRGAIIEMLFGNPSDNYLGRISSVRIENVQFRDIPVYFFDDMCAYIGKDFFQAFKISIDQKRNQILLRKHKDRKIENNVIDYGLSMRYDNGRLFVMGVWEGSAADETGINPGDEILEIDGKKVSDYSYLQLRSFGDYEEHDKRDYVIKGPEGERRITLKKRPLLPEIEGN